MTLTITRPLQTARRRLARAAALTAAVLSVTACFAANPATADALAIYTETCDIFKAGTDANVYVQLQGTKSTSPWLHLNTPGVNDFERGDTDYFSFPNLTYSSLGGITSIVIQRDTWGVGDGWCLDHVQVNQAGPFGYVDTSKFTSPNKWVPAGPPGIKMWP